MTRVHVLGAAGYAAAEFVRYAQGHPHLELGVLESASHAGSPLGDAFPALRRSARTFDGRGAGGGAVLGGDVGFLGGVR